ncbi:MAG: hypothetical protein ACOYXC_14785 [Candidatus Rifleibacteriota bacterium]
MNCIKPGKRRGFVYLLAIAVMVAVVLFASTLSNLNQNFRNQVNHVAYQEASFQMASSVLAGIMARVYAKPWSQRFFKDNFVESSDNPILNGTYDSYVENSPGKNHQFDVYIKVNLQGKSQLYFWRIAYHDSILDISQNFSKIFYTRKDGDKFPQGGKETLANEVDEILAARKENLNVAKEKTTIIETINDTRKIAEVLDAPFIDFPDPTGMETTFDPTKPDAPDPLPPLSITSPPETEKPIVPKPVPDPVSPTTDPPSIALTEPPVSDPPPVAPDPTDPQPAPPPPIPEEFDMTTYPMLSQDTWMKQKMEDISKCLNNSEVLLASADNLDNRCDYKTAYNYFFGEYGVLAATSHNGKIFEMYGDAQSFLSDAAGKFPSAMATLERAQVLDSYLTTSYENFKKMIDNSRKTFEVYKSALDKFKECAETPEDLTKYEKLLSGYEKNKENFESQLTWDLNILIARRDQWAASLAELEKAAQSEQAWGDFSK